MVTGGTGMSGTPGVCAALAPLLHSVLSDVSSVDLKLDKMPDEGRQQAAGTLGLANLSLGQMMC